MTKSDASEKKNKKPFRLEEDRRRLLLATIDNFILDSSNKGTRLAAKKKRRGTKNSTRKFERCAIGVRTHYRSNERDRNEFARERRASRKQIRFLFALRDFNRETIQRDKEATTSPRSSGLLSGRMISLIPSSKLIRNCTRNCPLTFPRKL